MESSINTLEIWKESKILRSKLFLICNKFPKEEKYLLKDQIIRASRAATSNIAEGYGRYTYKESIHFYIISRGSLYELIDHLSVALEQKYIIETEYCELAEEITILIKRINAYINYLKRKK